MVEHEKHTSNHIDGKRNYGRKISTDNKNKWRTHLHEGELNRIEEIAYNGMKLFDYGILQATEAKAITTSEVLRGRGRDALAMIFVGNRYRQNNSLKQRGKALWTKAKKLTL